MPNCRLTVVGACVLLAGAAAHASAKPWTSTAARTVPSGKLSSRAASTPVGGRLRLTDVEVPATSESLSFDVERFEVFAPDAVITVHGAGGIRELKRPADVYFRGSVSGEPGSRVFLDVQANGSTRGIVERRGESIYLLNTAQEPERLERLRAERQDPAMLQKADEAPWTCDEERLPTPPVPADLTDGISHVPLAKSVPNNTARVAIETDFEFFQLFGNASAAMTYVGDLIGYASTIYQSEINTSLLVGSISLWTTSSDPWTQFDTFCGLMEFGKYWNANSGTVQRTIAHFMSGKGNGGGIAWIGVLCSGSFSTGAALSCPGIAPEVPPNWGGAYGYTGNLFGDFDVNSPAVIWDIVAVAHEIGHNFNSPHTHCYNNIGDPSPIDDCRSNECKATDAFGNCVSFCYVGSQSLPDNSPVSASGGTSGQGNGTIMSYCHLLSGGMSNLSLSFGTGHPFGILPGRVPSRMSAHVAAVAGGNPACLTPALFWNAFEEGAIVGPTGKWSGQSPP
jgi:metallopeptidase family M12-like protein